MAVTESIATSTCSENDVMETVLMVSAQVCTLEAKKILCRTESGGYFSLPIPPQLARAFLPGTIVRVSVARSIE